jgi:hypothetical protein
LALRKQIAFDEFQLFTIIKIMDTDHVEKLYNAAWVYAKIWRLEQFFI